MASIYVPTSVTANVVKVSGVCYERVGPSSHAVTDTPDETFDSCEECEEAPTPDPTPTPVPTPTPEACPESCTSCADTYTASVVSSSCDCTQFPGIANGKVKTVTRLTGEGENCIWEYVNNETCDLTWIRVSCNSALSPDQWQLSVTVSSVMEEICFAICTRTFYKTGGSCPAGVYTGTCGTVTVS